MKQKLGILFILLVGAVLSVSAQDQPLADTISMQVYYKQGNSTFDPEYRGNGDHLLSFMTQMHKVRMDTTLRIRAIRIYAGASPEGSSALNKTLSEKRAASIAAVLKRYMPENQDLFRVVAVGVDWAGLERMVEQSDMPYRDEVLNILRNTPEWVTRNGVVVDSRKHQLTALHNGKAWWYMYDHFFPELRGAGGRIVCEVERIQKPLEVHPVVDLWEPTSSGRDSLLAVPEVVVESPAPVWVSMPKPFYMALKTNLLYDALLVPNLGIEFYLGRGWSVGADWMYAWWKTDRKHYYWRVYGGEFSVRKYFGRAAEAKPLTGHHLGLYGQMMTYDFELGGTGYLSKLSYGGGIEYGYSFPIGRRFNLDLGLGVGYWGGEYKKYIPIDTHYVWQLTGRRHWIGPTKAEITLVWLIGRGNYNKGK